jgi:Skp family chaperone for outer membrane proteins
MQPFRSGFTALVLAVLELGVAGVLADDSRPEQVLSGRGLKRSGAMYLLPAEAEFVPKVGKLQPSYRELKARYDELAATIQNRAEYQMLDDQWTLVNEQLRKVQAEQDAHPATTNNELKQSWRNLLELERQLRFQYSELQREVNLRYPRLVSESKTEQLRDVFLKQRDEFLTGSRELRELGEEIKNNYRALSQDNEVKQALDALKGSTKSRIGLGPSADFKKASAWLTTAVRSTAPETLKPPTGKKKANNSSTVKSQSKGKNATNAKDRPGKTATKGSRAGS